MKKKKLSGLSLNKKTISSFDQQKVAGGGTTNHTCGQFTCPDMSICEPSRAGATCGTGNASVQYCGNTTVPAPTLAGRSVCVCM